MLVLIAILADMAFGWNSLLGRLRGSRDLTQIVSFVFLESAFERLSDDALLERAHTAYGRAKPKGGIELLKNRTADSRVLRMENFFFAFHQAQQRYSRPPFESPEAIDQAWNNHVCWSGFDWAAPKLEEKDKPGARQLMLPLVGLLWSANTTGLFFPDRGLTIPNVGDLPESIRWAGRNGIPVQELFPPQVTSTPAK
ncbi:MAG TPA: hypothetical protein VG714_10030 [Acidobacteriaceae bacterium]|nr:hypothetical protein [Acidobacteriaceae bacterium]